jgi:hypothetical protein
MFDSDLSTVPLHEKNWELEIDNETCVFTLTDMLFKGKIHLSVDDIVLLQTIHDIIKRYYTQKDSIDEQYI